MLGPELGRNEEHGTDGQINPASSGGVGGGRRQLGTSISSCPSVQGGSGQTARAKWREGSWTRSLSQGLHDTEDMWSGHADLHLLPHHQFGSSPPSRSGLPGPALLRLNSVDVWIRGEGVRSRRLRTKIVWFRPPINNNAMPRARDECAADKRPPSAYGHRCSAAKVKRRPRKGRLKRRQIAWTRAPSSFFAFLFVADGEDAAVCGVPVVQARRVHSGELVVVLADPRRPCSACE